MAARRFGCPILTSPSSEYTNLVARPGSCCAVRISKDGKTILKSAMTFVCSGLDGKTTRQSAGISNESERLMKREVEIYRHLGSHEGILSPVFSDIGLIFPYLPRGDLRHVLCTESITTAQRAAWAQSVVSTLVYVHSKGVLIGDISTRNVLVRDDDTIAVSGSGLGSLQADVCPETRYEMLDGEGNGVDVSMATEIFAMGSLIYEIVTSKRPYDELSDEEVRRLYVEKEYPPHDVLLGSVIERCWLGIYDQSPEVLAAIKDCSNSMV